MHTMQHGTFSGEHGTLLKLFLSGCHSTQEKERPKMGEGKTLGLGMRAEPRRAPAGGPRGFLMLIMLNGVRL